METSIVKRKKVLKILHDITTGFQDVSLKGLPLPQKYIKIDYTHMEKYESGSRHLYRIPHPTNLEGLGVANIRINEIWQSLELELGGQQIDKIYEFMGLNSFDLTDNGSFIPFVKYHEIYLIINKPLSAECLILYDIVNIPKYDNLSSYSAIQFTGEETVKASPSTANAQKIRLYYNNPISQLYVKFEKPVESLSLFVNGKTEIALTPVAETLSEWLLEFGENSANFSQIDNASLHFKSEENSVRSYAVSKNIMRIYGGMYGAAFRI